MTRVGADLAALADDIAELPMSTLIDVAKAAKKLVADEGNRIAGADGMRGKKRRGLKLKARDDIRRLEQGAAVRIQGSVPGWIWANTGTAPHAIRRRKRGPMRKMVVHHPGMAGRGAWDRVAERLDRELDQAIDRQMRKVRW